MQKLLKLMHQRPLLTGVSLPQNVMHHLTATVPDEEQDVQSLSASCNANVPRQGHWLKTSKCVANLYNV